MTETSKTFPRKKALTALSVLAILSFVLLKFLPWGSIGEAGFLFFGRTHPLWLHLPIGILAGLFLVEVVNFFRPQKQLDTASEILLAFSIVTLLPTLVSGYILASKGEYNQDYIEGHEDMAWFLAFALSFLPLLRLKSEGWGMTPYRIGLCVVMFLMTVAGHRGGELTHGRDYLTELLPGPLKEIFGGSVEEEGQEMDEVLAHSDLKGPNYEKDIKPIVKEYCFRCHGPEKQKGDIQMDHLSADMSDYEDMEIWELSLLQVLYEEMPPEGKPQPSEEEKKLLTDWIISSLKKARKEDE